MNQEENLENQSICRLATKKQSLDDMYSVPANFLEIDVINPQTTIIAGKKKYTDYEIRMRVSLCDFSGKFRCSAKQQHPIISFIISITSAYDS
jgi:hypothetical protein